MTQAPATPGVLRRLIDLPGLDALEMKALMQPRLADPDLRPGLLDDHPDIDEAARAAFGLTLDQADAVALPADWDDIHRLPPADMVEAFAAEGWDVTDKRRKPLRMLAHWALPLALAMRGLAGALPFAPEPDHPATDWGAGLKSEAARFRKR